MLTEREKELMHKAFFQGFDHGVNYEQYKDCELRHLFNGLIHEQVSDCLNVGELWSNEIDRKLDTQK